MIKLNQRGSSPFIIVALVVVLAAGGLVAWRVAGVETPIGLTLLRPKSVSAKFEKDVKLKVNQKAVFSDNGGRPTLRVTKLEPPKDPNARCVELCTSNLPTIETELEFGGNSYKGQLLSSVGYIDMSYEENGAYKLIPYAIKIVGTDLDKYEYVTVKVHKKEQVKADIGKQFTLRNGGIAVLEPMETGAHVAFGLCGFNAPCIHDLDVVIGGKEISGAYRAFKYRNAKNYHRAKPGTSVERDGIRLRLINSDDKTYATFVFEKV